VARQDSFFADHANEFQIQNFPRLKPAHVFSRKFDGTSGSIAPVVHGASMLRFQPEAIPTSLTYIESKTVRRTAVHVFRSILAVMGDRPAPDVVSLAREVRARAVLSSITRSCARVLVSPTFVHDVVAWRRCRLYLRCWRRACPTPTCVTKSSCSS
jgi:hypothetical protein